MMTDSNMATLSQPSETGLIELSDEELNTVAGGRHHHGHHGHHSGAIAHDSHDFCQRSLSISVQKITNAHGTTITNFSIELIEGRSHAKQT